jgi:uncharacterized membrane protein
MTRTLFDIRTSAGRYMFAAGLIAVGALGLWSADFMAGQSVPASLPYRSILAQLAGGYILITGAALAFRRTAPASAAAIVAYFIVLVMGVMDGAELVAQWKVYGEYESAAEQFALASAALVLFAETAPVDARLSGQLKRAGQITFGICAIIFGGAHFAYMNLTAPLVPKWLPPSQVFWGYATGFAHIIAGLAILTGFRGRLAAILLTIMYASFQPLVHIPMLMANPSSHFEWCENAINLALVGAAWVMADSFRKPQADIPEV